MALSIDVGGSSTSAADISTGGNAGITFAPKGLTPQTLLLIAAVAAAAWYLLRK